MVVIQMYIKSIFCRLQSCVQSMPTYRGQTPLLNVNWQLLMTGRKLPVGLPIMFRWLILKLKLYNNWLAQPEGQLRPVSNLEKRASNLHPGKFARLCDLSLSNGCAFSWHGSWFPRTDSGVSTAFPLDELGGKAVPTRGVLESGLSS